jgi:hypothetical protein
MPADENFQLTDRDLEWLHAQRPAMASSLPNTAETATLRTLIGARLLGPALDRQIASGTPPETSVLLAARARLLATGAMRKKIARGWEKLLAPPSGSALLHAIRTPVPRAHVAHFEEQICTMLGLLRTPFSDVRGVAMVNALLCDGAGPLYSLSTNIPLGPAITEAIHRLGPLAS